VSEPRRSPRDGAAPIKVLRSTVPYHRYHPPWPSMRPKPPSHMARTLSSLGRPLLASQDLGWHDGDTALYNSSTSRPPLCLASLPACVSPLLLSDSAISGNAARRQKQACCTPCFRTCGLRLPIVERGSPLVQVLPQRLLGCTSWPDTCPSSRPETSVVRYLTSTTCNIEGVVTCLSNTELLLVFSWHLDRPSTVEPSWGVNKRRGPPL